MYHRPSAGSISYAEFRHLGKKDLLGRYAIHFHLVRDTMRGSSVIGASIWDSHNRWLTIHGTITWWSATAWAINRSVTAFSWRMPPNNTTFSTATWLCMPNAASGCRTRSCRSTPTMGPVSGGQRAQYLHTQRLLRQ